MARQTILKTKENLRALTSMESDANTMFDKANAANRKFSLERLAKF